ncbi:MAG: type 4a pilus biogenesis protein PilO [Candidatus Beckwithbacteria bacterium]|nr:type 4a pilus biogenesis protein PilO [Candidatus Beckwithbacteria bacterium]
MKQDYLRWAQQPIVRISGLISLTFFTVAFFGIFAIMPTFKTIAKLNKEIEDSQIIDSQLYKKTVSLQAAQTNYDKVINDLGLVNRVMPEREEFETLSWQIAWLASQKGVELTSGTFNTFNLVGPSETGLQTLEIDLTVSGPYLNIKDYFVSLTGFDRLITISDVNFGSKNSNNLKNNLNLTANLKLTAYWLPKEGK